MATMGDTVLAIIQNLVNIFIRIPGWFLSLGGEIRTRFVVVVGGTVFAVLILLWAKWVYL